MKDRDIIAIRRMPQKYQEKAYVDFLALYGERHPDDRSYIGAAIVPPGTPEPPEGTTLIGGYRA